MSKRFPLFILSVFVVFAVMACAQSPAKVSFFPLKDVKPGLKGIGRTVFSGNKVEEFQVEILGVLQNIGPRQSVILGRLSGGPLAETGVMAGMSGSPVYVDGKLLGAVALSFPFSKEPIAGITPIEQMAEVLDQPSHSDGSTIKVNKVNYDSLLTGKTNLLPAVADESVVFSPDRPRLERIATPLVLSGFTSRTLEQFEPQFRTLGLQPMQGGGGGSLAQNSVPGDASALQPGSMISVQLIRGDLGVNADGTVTYRDGNRIYAFGHRFLAAGPVDMPFAESNVITLLPNAANSFKISTPGRLLGTVRQDRASGILGAIGEQAHMIPVAITMHSANAPDRKYHFDVVNDHFLSPLLLQIAMFGTIDATERVLGESLLAVRGTIQLQGLPPVNVENLFSGDANTPMIAAQSTAVPLALLLQSGFTGIDVKGIQLDVTSSDQRRVTTVDQAWSSKREVQAGDHIEVTAVLRAENGSETVKKVPVDIPQGAGPGPLLITVADGNSLNLSEVRELPGQFTPKTPEQLVRAINNLRRNNRLYVRVARPQTSFLLHGVQFPSPPPSLARAMGNEASVSTNVATSQLSTLSETELDPLPSMVSGSKTITVTVKP